MPAERRLIVSRALVLGALVAVCALGTPAFAEATRRPAGEITEGCGEPRELLHPWALAFDSSGHLFVTDPIAKAVDEYDSANECVGQIGAGVLSGSDLSSVTVNDANGDLYVGESGLEDVFVFRPEGVGKYKLVQKDHIEGFMFVAYDNSSGPNKGDLYVTDAPNHVYVAKSNAEGLLGEGNFEEDFLNEGSEVIFSEEDLTPPAGGFLLSTAGRGGIAVDNTTGKLYLAEPGHFAVSVYGPEGVFQKKIEGGESPAKSFEPVDVGVEESTGDVYIVDLKNKVVDQYSSEGKYLGQIKGISEGEPFAKPLGVAVQPAGASKGQVYVSDGTKVDIFEAPPKPKFPLTVTKSGTGSGTVTSEPAGINCAAECTHELEEGTLVTLKEKPAGGSSFAEWSGACSGSGETCEVTMTEAKTVNALFSLGAPVNTGLPIVEGTAKEGHTLKANPGSWEGSPASFSYEWEDCNALGEECSKIATGSEYTLTSADVGHTVRVVVTAKNAGGSSSPARSETVMTVEGPPEPEATASSTIEGEVPRTTTLETTCTGADLGVFLPGREATYEGHCALTATSTGAESTLAVADETGKETGHLENGSYYLAKPLQARAEGIAALGGISGTGGGLASLTSPVLLLSYSTPVSADEVTLLFSQQIGGHDPLHTGTYAKLITLTMKQTKP